MECCSSDLAGQTLAHYIHDAPLMWRTLHVGNSWTKVFGRVVKVFDSAVHIYKLKLNASLTG